MPHQHVAKSFGDKATKTHFCNLNKRAFISIILLKIYYFKKSFPASPVVVVRTVRILTYTDTRRQNRGTITTHPTGRGDESMIRCPDAGCPPPAAHHGVAASLPFVQSRDRGLPRVTWAAETPPSHGRLTLGVRRRPGDLHIG